MNTYADKIQRHKNKSKANSILQKSNGVKPASRFMDNRPEAFMQKKLQKIADNGSKAIQMKAFQNTAEGLHIYMQNQPIQKKENNTGLPDNLKSGIENISGLSLNDVKVHRNSDKPAHLQAHAYTQGTDIYLGPQQEKHLPHEAWHVVQQKQGRVKPTTQMGNISINNDEGLEKEADINGNKAIQRVSFDSSLKTNNYYNSSSIIQNKLTDTFGQELSTTTARSWIEQWKETSHGSYLLGMYKNRYGISPQLTDAYLEQLILDDSTIITVQKMKPNDEEASKKIGDAVLTNHFNNTSKQSHISGLKTDESGGFVNKLLINLDEGNKKINEDLHKMLIQSKEDLIENKKISAQPGLQILAPNAWLVLVCHGDPRIGDKEPEININDTMTTGKGLAKILHDLQFPNDRTIHIDITACQTGWQRRGTSFADVFKKEMAAKGFGMITVRAPISLTTTEDTGEKMLNLPFRSLMKNKQALMSSQIATVNLVDSIEKHEVKRIKKRIMRSDLEVTDIEERVNIETLKKLTTAFTREAAIFVDELKWYFKDDAVKDLQSVKILKGRADHIIDNIQESMDQLYQQITDEKANPEVIKIITANLRKTLARATDLVMELPSPTTLQDQGNVDVVYQQL